MSLQLLLEGGCGGATPWWLALLKLVLVTALAAGVLTPVAALLGGIFQLACLAHADWPQAALPMTSAMTAVALVLLGAGAYSVDARLFGRRRLVVPADPVD